MNGLERTLALLKPEERERGGTAPAGYLDLVGEDAPESTGAIQDLSLIHI